MAQQPKKPEDINNPLAGLFNGMNLQGGGFGNIFNQLFAVLANLFGNAFGGLGNVMPESVGRGMRSTAQSARETSSERFDLSGPHAGKGIEALKNLVGRHESNNDYDRVYGAGVRRMPLTEMTVNEVLTWQKNYVDNGSASSAAGRYQIIQGTLKGLKKEMGLTGDEKFDAELQDRMFMRLAQKRGLNNYLSGEPGWDESRMMKELSKEWASLPKDATGQGNYDNDGLNRASASPASVTAALMEARNDAVLPGLRYASAQRTGQTLETTPSISGMMRSVAAGAPPVQQQASLGVLQSDQRMAVASPRPIWGDFSMA